MDVSSRFVAIFCFGYTYYEFCSTLVAHFMITHKRRPDAWAAGGRMGGGQTHGRRTDARAADGRTGGRRTHWRWTDALAVDGQSV